MIRAVWLFTFALTLTCTSAAAEKKSASREVSCKTRSNVNACYWTHGRLWIGNGAPSYRLWKIGAHRVLGIYSGQSTFDGPLARKYPLDNEGPELPANVEQALRRGATTPFGNQVFADFEICPLEPESADSMQAACIESAKDITIRP